MAKKSTTTAQATTATATGDPNKAQAIRDYHAGHPNAKPADVVKALAAQGVEVTAGRVSAVLRGNGGQKVDVEQIKRAAEFVKGYKGKVEDAVAAINAVGRFVDDCGSAEKAVKAIEAFRAVAQYVS
jgi:hypothetical protein